MRGKQVSTHSKASLAKDKGRPPQGDMVISGSLNVRSVRKAILSWV